MFASALFTIAKNGKTKCPATVGCIKKMWHRCVMDYYSAIKSEIKPFAATWIYLEIIY